MKIDPDALTPARRIHKRGKNQKANFLSGHKLDGIVQTESRFESAATYLAMIDPRVQKIRPQPLTFDLDTGRIYATKEDLTLEYAGSGTTPRPYTPDLKLTLNCGGHVFVETKSTFFIADNPDYRKLPAQLAELGHQLLLITEQILTETLSLNAKHMRPYAGEKLAKAPASAIANLGEGPFTFADAMRATGLSQSDIIRSILTGILAFDIQNQDLGPKTTLKAAGGSTAHLEILAL